MSRARRGGLAGGFFAVYIPADPTADKVNDRDSLPAALPLEYSLNHAMKMTAKLFEIERESRGDFKVVRSVADILAAKAAGAMSGILHFEGAEAIDENLYAAIDLLIDKIDRKVIQHKDRAQNHSHLAVKRQVFEAA
jgi:membrane dipeptidase